MIDPITAVGVATAAFNGIKQAISVGRDIQDMGSQLSQWAGAMSDLDFAQRQTENPPLYKKIFGAESIQKSAMELWVHKKKAENMREELRSFISLYYGPSAWEEIVHIEAQMRKERKEAIYRKEERKQKIIEWIVGIILALIMSGILGFVIYLIGLSKGAW